MEFFEDVDLTCSPVRDTIDAPEEPRTEQFSLDQIGGPEYLLLLLLLRLVTLNAERLRSRQFTFINGTGFIERIVEQSGQGGSPSTRTTTSFVVMGRLFTRSTSDGMAIF